MLPTVQEVSETHSATAAPELTAADRCDRCGAQAYVRVELPSGGELLFCGHHGRSYQDKLVNSGAKIEDQTARLS